jgi:hypothetical protein
MLEEDCFAGRPEVMPYSTYEDARAREAELLRSAQRFMVGAVPRRQRRAVFNASRIVGMLRRRDGAVRKPATGHI